MTRLIAALLVLTAVQARPDPQFPPRDPTARDRAASEPGTALIRGRVTDRETGRPLSRIMVTLALHPIDEERALSMRDGRIPILPRHTLTGADGGYELKEIPAGRYMVMFDPIEQRGTHLRQTLGSAEPTDEAKLRDLPPIIIKGGERRTNANIALWRARAIEGRVVTESGEPMANVEVSVHPADVPEPQMTFLGTPRITDDRGMFRLFGLKPGRYRICAKPTDVMQPTADIRDRAIRTCYPETRENAPPIILKDADVGGVELKIRRTRTYRIMGLAIDSSGAPLERGQIRLVTYENNSYFSSGIESRPGGQFIIQGVTPGEYGIQAEIGSLNSSSDRREPELGYVSVRIDAADVEGVLVTTVRLAKVAGRVIFEDGAPARRNTMYVVASRDRTVMRGITAPSPLAQVAEDLTFELTRLFGLQVIAVWDRPPGWVVKTVKYRGEDVTDLPVELKSSTDPRDLEITLTNRGALLTGRVLDERGQETYGQIVLISADVARRGGGWHIAVIGSSTPDGRFTLEPVRAGEYIVVALGAESSVQFGMDPKEVERMAKAGERLVLGENQKRVIDLRVGKPE